MTSFDTIEELEEVLVEEVIDESSTGNVSMLIVYNFKGKATVKTAPKPELRPKKEALTDKGLSAVIEDMNV